MPRATGESRGQYDQLANLSQVAIILVFTRIFRLASAILVGDFGRVPTFKAGKVGTFLGIFTHVGWRQFCHLAGWRQIAILPSGMLADRLNYTRLITKQYIYRKKWSDQPNRRRPNLCDLVCAGLSTRGMPECHMACQLN